MFCQKCGKEMQDGWTACPNCGEAVNNEPEVQQTSVNVPVKGKKPIFKRWWFWGIIVIIFLLFIGILGGSDDSTEESKTSTSSEEPKKTQGNKETETEEDKSEYPILEIYQALGENEDVPFTINDKASRFLKDHADYFPTTNYDYIAATVDTTIEYKHVDKNSEQYGDKLMELQELYVVSIAEFDIGNGETVTELETIDANDNSYYILYKGTLENIYADDVVKADILPLGVSGYDNVSGGTTTALIGAGSYVIKVEIPEEY